MRAVGVDHDHKVGRHKNQNNDEKDAIKLCIAKRKLQHFMLILLSY